MYAFSSCDSLISASSILVSLFSYWQLVKVAYLWVDVFVFMSVILLYKNYVPRDGDRE